MRVSESPATIVGSLRRSRAALLRSTALQAAVLAVVALPIGARAEPPAPNAQPGGGTVIAGQARIRQSATTTTIDQSSASAALNWQSFNVGSQQRVQFNQPSSSALTLNRVVSPDASQIAGRITANGRIVLMNQSGVVFLPGSSVDAQSVVVSAASMSDGAMRSAVGGGRLAFDLAAKPGAVVSNAGRITVAETGLAALVAPQVANSGVISARLGHVVLAGAETATLDLYGDGLLSIDVTKQVTQGALGARPASSLVSNTGTITASGGTVLLTAAAADGVVQTLVTAGGRISANSVGSHAGTVVISGTGGSVVVEGALQAEGHAPGTQGGRIAVVASGDVTLTHSARVNASGAAGGGLIAIGTTLARAAGGASVIPTMVAKHTTIEAGAVVRADATGTGTGAGAGQTGAGGRITVLSSATTDMAGGITARGAGGGNGGFVELSGVTGFKLTGTVDVGSAGGAKGTILLDPRDLLISDTQPTGVGGITPDPTSPNVPAGDGSTDAWVATSVINALTGNVVLQAARDLTVDGRIGLGSGTELELDAGRNLTVTANGALAAGTVFLKAADSAISGYDASGGITITGSVTGLAPPQAGIGSIVLSAGTGGVTIAGSLTAGLVDISTTGGGVTETGNGVILGGGVLTSTSGITGDVILNNTANRIGALNRNLFNGNFSVSTNLKVTGGNLSLVDGQDLSVVNTVSADNVLLKLTGGHGLTAQTFSVIESGNGGTTGRVSVAADRLTLNGFVGSGPVLIGGIVEIAPSTPGTDISLSSGTAGLYFDPNNLAFIRAADLLRIGAYTDTGNGAATPTTTARDVDLASALDLTQYNFTAAPSVEIDAGRNLAIADAGSTSGTPNAALTVSQNLILRAGRTDPTGRLAQSGEVVAQHGYVYMSAFAGGVAIDNVVSASTRITLQTDALSFGANAALRTNGGTIEIAPATPGTAMYVGGAGPAGGAGLFVPTLPATGTDAAPAATLVLGAATDPDTGTESTTASTITLQGALSKGNLATLDLEASGAVTQTEAGSLVGIGRLTGTVGALDFSNSNNQLRDLGRFTTTEGDLVLTVGANPNDAPLSVRFGAVQAAAGGLIAITAPSLVIESGGDFRGSLTVAAGAGGGGRIVLTADSMTIAGPVGAPGGSVTLQPLTAGRPVELIGDADTPTVGTLSLTQGALSEITTKTLIVGSAQAGQITVRNAITLTGGIATALLLHSADAAVETTGGSLAVSELGGDAASATLNGGNAIPTLLAFTATGGFALTDGQALQLTGALNGGTSTVALSITGTLTEAAGGFITAGTLSGSATSVTLDQANSLGAIGDFTADGGFLLDSTGNLAITGALESGNATVALNITGGALTESGSGFITAGLLTGSATSASLTGGNAVSALGPFTATGGFSLSDDIGLAITGALNAGTGTVTLTLPGAALTDTITGMITAGLLTGSARSVALDAVGNAITDLGAFTTTGDFALANAGPLNVTGAVSAGSAADQTDTTITLSTAGTITVTATGALTASQISITAGNAGTEGNISIAGAITAYPSQPPDTSGTVGGGITLTASNGGVPGGGTITQTGGTIDTGTGGTLTLIADGAVTQTGGIIKAGTLAGSARSVTLKDANVIDAVGGFTATGGFTLADTTDLAISGALNGGASTVALDVTAGTLTESGSGAITAGTLTGFAATATLDGANVISGLGAFTATGGFSLASTGNLTITGALDGGTATVALKLTDGALSESGTGTITAGTLSGSASSATLDGANAVGTIDNFSATGGFALASTGNLVITGHLDGGTSNVALDVTTGTLSEAGGGFITAGILSGQADSATLGGANVIQSVGGIVHDGDQTVAGFAAHGGFLLTDTTDLAIGGLIDAGTSVVTLTVAGNLTEEYLRSAGQDELLSFGGITAGLLTGSADSVSLNHVITTSFTTPGNAVLGIGGYNTIAAVGAFAAPGNFTLDDSGTQMKVTQAPGVNIVAQSIIGVGPGGTMVDPGGPAPVQAVQITGTLNAGSSAVSLTTIGSLTETGSGTITAGSLVTTAASVSLGNTNSIGSLGAVSAPGGFSLANTGNLSLTGALNAGASTVALTINNGTLTETGAGAIMAGTLTGAASSATLNGANGVASIADFTAPGGFSLASTGNLAISGTLDAGSSAAVLNIANGTLTETGSGTITAGRLGGSATSVTLANTNTIPVLDSFTAPGGFALNDSGSLVLAGTLDGGTSTVSLNLPNGSLTADGGLIIAGTLNADPTFISLVNANVIAALGNVTAPGGITLNDSEGLAITGTVDAGTSTVTLGVAGALTGPGGSILAGQLTGNAEQVSLTGNNSIAILGAFSAHGGFTLNDTEALRIDATLDAGTTGTVVLTIAGTLADTTGAITAGTLSGSATIASIDSASNAIGAIGAFAAPDGFSFADNQPVTITGLIDAGGSAANFAVNGGVAETGGGAITAAVLVGNATSAALGGSNNIGLLGNFTVAQGFGLTNATNLAVVGTLDAGASAVGLNVAGTLTEPGGFINAGTLGGSATSVALTGTNRISAIGNLAASAGLSLSDQSALSLTGTLASGTGPMSLVLANTLTETGGGLIAAPSLTGSAATATLAGPNLIGTLGAFSANVGGLVLNNAQALTLAGPISAPRVTISSTGQMVLAGNLALGGGTTNLLQVNTTPSGSGAQFTQTGSANITGSNRLTIAVAGTGGVESFANLAASGADLVLDLGGGTASGTITAAGLAVQGSGGGASLAGSVAGNATPNAALISTITPASNPAYTLNGCVIAAASCGTVTATATPAVAATGLSATSNDQVQGGLTPNRFLPGVPGALATLPQLTLVLQSGLPAAAAGALTAPDVVPPNVTDRDY